MTVQGIKESNQSNWFLPTAAGTVIGAGVGATALAGAKYKTFDDLVAAATSGDSAEFKMATVPEGATDEVKKDFKAVTDAVTKIKDNKKTINELYKDGDKALEQVEIAKVAEKLGFDAGVDKTAVKLADLTKGAAKDSEITISDAMKELFKKTADGKEVAGTAEEVTEGLKKLGAEVKDGKLFASETFIKNAKEAADKKGVVELLDKAKDGKLAKADVESFIKKGTSEASEAFAKIAKEFGKARVKGALIWGAVGLAAGYLVSKLFGGKSEKA